MSVLYAGSSEISPILDVTQNQKTFNILEYKQSDHTLNDIRWLRANTNSWQSGEMYESAYAALVEYKRTATLKSHTINNITVPYYLAENGFKIVVVEQVENVNNLYNAQGFADYFILDVDNKQFKLPRKSNRRIIKSQKPTKDNNYAWYNLYSDGWVEQGGKVGALDNSHVTVTLPIMMSNDSYMAVATGQNSETASDFAVAFVTPTTTQIIIASNASYGLGATWQVSGYAAESEYADLNDVLYDYYYVGEFAQTALLQTAGIASEKLNLIDQTIEDLKNAASGGAVDIVREFFDIVYPVGSLYIGTQSVCPMTAVIKSSVWELVTETGALWLGDGTNGGTTIEAGLPDHTHTIPLGKCDSGDHHAQGNQAPHPMAQDGSFYTVEKTRSKNSSLASVSNSVYGKSDTVQPPAYVVNVWRRVS